MWTTVVMAYLFERLNYTLMIQCLNCWQTLCAGKTFPIFSDSADNFERLLNSLYWYESHVFEYGKPVLLSWISIHSLHRDHTVLKLKCVPCDRRFTVDVFDMSQTRYLATAKLLGLHHFFLYSSCTCLPASAKTSLPLSRLAALMLSQPFILSVTASSANTSSLHITQIVQILYTVSYELSIFLQHITNTV